MRGCAHWQLGEPLRAVEDFGRAIALDPDDQSARRDRQEAIEETANAEERERGRIHRWTGRRRFMCDSLPPHPCGLASCADQLHLPFPLHAERPLEHGEGSRLRLAAAALRPHRPVGHELRPGEQRLLRLRGRAVRLSH